MIPGQPTESLFPRGLGKVALHPLKPTTAVIPAALPSAAPPRLENQSRYEKVGLALAKANPELRRAVGETLDRFAILEPGSEERVPFAAQVLPVVSTNRNDPCSTDRCVDLIFRTENGYLPLRAHVDLTRRAVAVHGGGRRR